MKLASRPVLLWLAVVLLALSALAAKSGHGVAPRHLLKPLASLPSRIGPWQASDQDGKIDQRTLEVLKPSSYLVRTYRRPGYPAVALFVAFFAKQEEGAMIHSPRHCLPGAGWEIVGRREVALSGPAGQGPFTVNRFTLSHNLSRMSVLYWYQGRGRVEANEYRDRVHLVLDGALANRSDGALVRLTTALALKPEAEVLAGQQYLAARVLLALDRILPPQGPSKE